MLWGSPISARGGIKWGRPPHFSEKVTWRSRGRGGEREERVLAILGNSLHGKDGLTSSGPKKGGKREEKKEREE